MDCVYKGTTSAYSGMHWPMLDEYLCVSGLIGYNAMLGNSDHLILDRKLHATSTRAASHCITRRKGGRVLGDGKTQ
jgi:hypothetical protein